MMQERYIDCRPRAPSVIFDIEPLPSGFVRLRNTETKRTHVEDGAVFRRNYERMSW
jgi:hypothetical protein